MIHEEQIEIDSLNKITSLIKDKNIFKNIYYDILCLLNNIKYFFYDIRYGIQNIIYYLPVIWKDRDWDNEYILDLLKYKLKKNEKNLRKYSIAVDNDKTADEIKNVVDLIEIYPNITLEADPDFKYQEYIENIEDEEEKDYWIRRYYTSIYNMEDECYKMIFELLGRNSQKWWW